MTKGTIEHISTCHPLLIEKFIQLRNRCKQINDFDKVYDLIVTCGYRSLEESKKLSEKEGSIAAPAGRSYHNYWLAFDVAPMGRTTKDVAWDDGKAWDIIGNCSTGLGLEWGGNWSEKRRDRPHFNIQNFTIEELRNRWLFTNNLLSDVDRKRLFFEWITAMYLKSVI